MNDFANRWERDRAAAYAAVNAEYQRECDDADDDDDEAAYKAAYTKLKTAHDAVTQKFNRLWDRHEAEAERKRKAAALERQRAEQEAARKKAKALKQAERERVAARYDAARKFMEDATPPGVTISPRQAAARVGLTMSRFWSLVRSGRYPAPNDENEYDLDTVERLPRPKVRVRRVVADNFLTCILRF